MSRNARRLLLAIAIAGIIIRALVLWDAYHRLNCGADFPVFYTGGKLAASPDLYSAPAVQAVETREMGCTSDSSIFIRLPWFAAFQGLLSRFPLRVAWLIWFWGSLAALGGFIELWGGSRIAALAACAWSLPVSWDLTQGNDVCLLLFWFACGLWLVRAGRDFTAGLVLSLLSAKLHLFVFLPLVFLFHRRRMVLLGGLGGGAILGGISFATQGWNWPARFLHAVNDSRIDPFPGALQNIRGVAAGNSTLEITLMLVVAFAAVYICRYASFDHGLCAALLAGIAASHHLSGSDYSLLIPVMLILAADFRSYLRLPGLLMLTPADWYLSRVIPRLTAAIPLAMLLAIVYAAWDANRKKLMLPAKSA